MSPATELHETNDLLRSAIQTPAPQHERPTRIRDSAPGPMLPSTCLIAAHQFFGMNVLGDNFIDLPAKFFSRDGRDCLIACPCGREIRLFYGQMERCRCHRWYWNGTTVKVAAAPDPTEPIPCDNCDANTTVSEGKWGEDGFYCPRCHG